MDSKKTKLIADDIDALIKGTILLGSGGGGDERNAVGIGITVLLDVLKENIFDVLKDNEIEIIPVGNISLSDDELAFIPMMVGYSKKRLSITDANINRKIKDSIKNMLIEFKSEHPGKKLKYAIPYESGIFNLIFTILVVIINNFNFNDKLSIVDCDCSGRGIPAANLTPLFMNLNKYIFPIQCAAYQEGSASGDFRHFRIYTENKNGNDIIKISQDKPKNKVVYYSENKNGNTIINPFIRIPGQRNMLKSDYLNNFDVNLKDDIINQLGHVSDEISYGSFCCCWGFDKEQLKEVKKSENLIGKTVSNIIETGLLFPATNDFINKIKNIFQVNNVYHLVEDASIVKNNQKGEAKKERHLKYYYDIIELKKESFIYELYIKNEILQVREKNGDRCMAMAPDIIFIMQNNFPMTLADLLDDKNDDEANINIYGFKVDDKISGNNKLTSEYVNEIKSICDHFGRGTCPVSYISIDVLNP